MKTRFPVTVFAVISIVPLAAWAESTSGPKPKVQTPPISLVTPQNERPAERPIAVILKERNRTIADELTKGRLIPVPFAGSRVEIGFKAEPAADVRTPPRSATERPVAVQFQVVRFRF